MGWKPTPVTAWLPVEVLAANEPTLKRADMLRMLALGSEERPFAHLPAARLQDDALRQGGGAEADQDGRVTALAADQLVTDKPP